MNKPIKTKKVLFLLLFFSAVFLTRGQDVSFSQFYSNPLFLNPAFAGSAEIPRLALQYRNQWHSFNNAFNTYSAALDFPVKKMQGGLGLFVLNDAQAASSYRWFQVNAAYAVFIPLSEQWRLHGALQAGLHQHSLDVSQLIFPDNVDPNFGNHGVSAEMEYLSGNSFSFVDFSSGLLLYNPQFFGGIALHHLGEPRQSFSPGTEHSGDKLSRKYTFHAGARLPVYLYGHHEKKFDISPQLVMQKQGPFGQINYGLLATKRGLTTGAWFRQNLGLRYDAVILLAGFMKNNWQITYTYDMAVSGLWGETGGTSEISLVFLLEKPDKRRNLPFYRFQDYEFGSD